MIGIEKSYANAVTRRQFNSCWRFQRYWLQYLLEVPIGLLAAFENVFGEIHAMRELFKSKQKFSGGRAAIHERCFQCVQSSQMIGVDMAEEACQGRWSVS